MDDERPDIFSGAHVSNLSFVDKLNPFRVQTENLPFLKHIQDHLEDLHERSFQGLTSERCKEVVELLLNHEALFSESDSALGQTCIMKHSVPTENAHHIKQHVRRLPEQMHEAINKKK